MSGPPASPTMTLRLDDGTTVEGRSIGAARPVRGEVVFNTGMTGYVEALTDPSYRGQILVLTYPLQGNYGVPAERAESDRIQVQGLVIQRLAVSASHHASTRALDEWLRAEGVPAIDGVDTRALTRKLREHGTIGGVLSGADADDSSLDTVDMNRVAELVACKEIVRLPGGDLRLLVIDTGVKESIVRSLRSRGATVIRAPFFSAWESLVDEVHGVVLGNGPGDPTVLAPLVERVRTILAKRAPLFGVCLGHQLIALAGGARTYKLPYGHRSQNQPVIELTTRHALLTSQNHGYAVDDSSLSKDWEPWFVNLNDGTNEGIRHRHAPVRSVQFHPEGAPGPRDAAYLFDDFVRMATEMRRPSEANRISSATESA